jgi:hypothetical protein
MLQKVFDPSKQIRESTGLNYWRPRHGGVVLSGNKEKVYIKSYRNEMPYNYNAQSPITSVT